MDEAHALAKRSSTRDGRYQTRDVKKGSESLGSWILDRIFFTIVTFPNDEALRCLALPYLLGSQEG
jgi:hypothetical protein